MQFRCGQNLRVGSINNFTAFQIISYFFIKQFMQSYNIQNHYHITDFYFCLLQCPFDIFLLAHALLDCLVLRQCHDKRQINDDKNCRDKMMTTKRQNVNLTFYSIKRRFFCLFGQKISKNCHDKLDIFCCLSRQKNIRQNQTVYALLL